MKPLDDTARLDFTPEAAYAAMQLAGRHLTTAVRLLMRGDAPASIGALDACMKALGAARDSLAGLLGGG